MKHKILVIEDSPMERQLIAHALVDEGYDVVSAATGEEGIALATCAHVPDLVLLDIGLPDITGYDVCSRIKKGPCNRHVPIIFLTAHEDEEDELRGLSLGAADYVRKTDRFCLMHLKLRIHNHLSLAELREEAEAKRQIAEHRYKTVFDGAADAIAVLTTDGTVLEWSAMAEAVTGFSPEEIIGQSFLMFAPDGNHEACQRRISTAHCGLAIRNNWVHSAIKHKNGDMIPAEIAISKLSNGEVAIFIHDLSERIELENKRDDLCRREQLWRVTAQSTVLQALRMLQSIIEDPLRSLAVQAKQAAAGTQLDSIVATGLSSVMETLEHITMSLPSWEPPGQIDMNKLAYDCVASMDQRMRRKIKITVTTAQDNPKGIGGAGPIHLALSNILLNAAQACGAEGEITVTTGSTAGKTWVSVGDNCGGVPQDIIESMFKPFLCAKSGHLGLGVALAREIIEFYGGNLMLNNNPGVGAEFIIRLQTKSKGEYQ